MRRRRGQSNHANEEQKEKDMIRKGEDHFRGRGGEKEGEDDRSFGCRDCFIWFLCTIKISHASSSFFFIFVWALSVSLQRLLPSPCILQFPFATIQSFHLSFALSASSSPSWLHTVAPSAQDSESWSDSDGKPNRSKEEKNKRSKNTEGEEEKEKQKKKLKWEEEEVKGKRMTMMLLRMKR